MAVINIKPKDVEVSLDILVKLLKAGKKPEPKSQPEKKGDEVKQA